MTPDFQQTMNRLAFLRNPPEDLTEYWRALQDIPAAVLDGAATVALRTRVFFPAIAELRADADVAARQLPRTDPAVDTRDRSRPLPAPVVLTVTPPGGGAPIHVPIDREWYYDCDACNDTGWIDCWCAPDATANPRRPHLLARVCSTGDHDAHAYMVPCACRATNPTIRRREDARRRAYADDPADAGRRRS